MTTVPPPQKVRLNRVTRRLMLRRSIWRRRALGAALQLAVWPAGKPGRELIESETIKSVNKVREWFRDPEAQLVISAIQRRAVTAFRNQFTEKA